MNRFLSDNEEQLLIQAQNGSRTAFSTLVKRYEEKVFYLAYDLVGDYDDAKDLAQDVFIRVYKKLDQFQARSKFSTWIYRITVNMAMDRHRMKNRYATQSLDHSMIEIDRMDMNKKFNTEKADDKVLQHEQHEHIQQALEKLSDNQKTAAILKYYHQKSSREIAEIMGCSESTARIHVFRALKNLQKHLKNYVES